MIIIKNNNKRNTNKIQIYKKKKKKIAFFIKKHNFLKKNHIFLKKLRKKKKKLLNKQMPFFWKYKKKNHNKFIFSKRSNFIYKKKNILFKKKNYMMLQKKNSFFFLINKRMNYFFFYIKKKEQIQLKKSLYNIKNNKAQTIKVTDILENILKKKINFSNHSKLLNLFSKNKKLKLICIKNIKNKSYYFLKIKVINNKINYLLYSDNILYKKLNTLSIIPSIKYIIYNKKKNIDLCFLIDVLMLRYSKILTKNKIKIRNLLNLYCINKKQCYYMNKKYKYLLKKFINNIKNINRLLFYEKANDYLLHKNYVIRNYRNSVRKKKILCT